MITQKLVYEDNRLRHSFSIRSSYKRDSVILYSTPICPWCRVTKDFLKDHLIKFREVDVSRNMNALKRMIKKSGQMSVPVINIDGKIIIGFDEDQLKEKLNL